MLGIMKKDFLPIVLKPNLILMGLVLFVWFGTQGEHDSSMAFIMGGWIYIFVLGSVISAEQYESKHNGYRFLSTLPVTAKEIIGGRSVLALVSVLIMAAGYVAFSPLVIDPGARDAFQNLVTLNSGLTLVLVGLLYLVAFKLGFSGFHTLLWTVIVLVGITPIIALEFFKEDVLELFDRLDRMSVMPVVALSLAVFAGLVFLAIKAKEGQTVAD